MVLLLKPDITPLCPQRDGGPASWQRKLHSNSQRTPPIYMKQHSPKTLTHLTCLHFYPRNTFRAPLGWAQVTGRSQAYTGLQELRDYPGLKRAKKATVTNPFPDTRLSWRQCPHGRLTSFWKRWPMVTWLSHCCTLGQRLS